MFSTFHNNGINSYSHSIALHPAKNYAEHLSKGGLCCSLIDKVPGSQINVIACPDSVEYGTLVDFTRVSRDYSQQSLQHTHESVQY